MQDQEYLEPMTNQKHLRLIKVEQTGRCRLLRTRTPSLNQFKNRDYHYPIISHGVVIC